MDINVYRCRTNGGKMTKASDYVTIPTNQVIITLTYPGLTPGNSYSGNTSGSAALFAYYTPPGSPPSANQYFSSPVKVYINGSNTVNGIAEFSATPNPPSLASNQYAVSLMLALNLYSAVNDIVVTPTNPKDPNAFRVRVIVIPGGGQDDVSYINSSLYGTNGVYVQSRSDFLSTSNTYYTSLQAQGYSLPAVPSVDIPLFQSYVISGNTIQYQDQYGRTIDPTQTYAGVTYQSTGYSDTLLVSIDSPAYYGKLQAYWSGSADPNVIWDENGYIKCTATGTYTLYPLTTKGYVILTIQVSAGPPTEITYYAPSGATIDVSSLAGFSSSTNITVPSPGISIVNGQINIPNPGSSVKFPAGNYVFNINVIPTPPVQSISVAQGFPYTLSQLANLNPNIPDSAFTAAQDSGNGTLGSQSGSPYIWSNSSTIGAVYLYGVLVANITSKQINYTASSIFAPQGRNVNLFNFFQNTSPGDALLEVYNPGTDQIVSSPDGTIRFGKISVVSLSCKVLLSGVEIIFNGTASATQPSPQQGPIPVTVVSDNADTYYVTSTGKWTVQLPNSQAMSLITTGGEQETIVDGLQTRELQASVSVNNPSNGTTTYSITVLQQCLLLYGSPGSSASTEVVLIPFQSLQDTNTPITIVKDTNGNATIEMPAGPTYQICASNAIGAGSVNDTLTFTGSGVKSFAGGTYVFAPAASTLYMLATNVITTNAGPQYYTLNIVEGNKVVINMVNSFTITNATPLVPLPTPYFITQSGSNLVVTRNPSFDMTQIFVAQTTNSTGNTVYNQYIFNILPPVKLQQTLYYTSTMVFTDILPMGGYQYPSTLDLTQTIKPASGGSTTVLVDFDYGEFTTGVFTLVLTDKTVTTKQIYLEALIDATEVHTTDGDNLPLPYGSSTSDVIFALASSGNQILVTLIKPGVSIGEYYFVDGATGNSTLYLFQSVPAPTHADVYLFGSATGQSTTTWVPDVPVYYNGSHYNVGQPLTISGEVTVNIDYSNDPTSPYYMNSPSAGVAFNIVDVVGKATEVTFCQQWTQTFSNSIDSYMTAPPTRIPFSGSAAFKTLHFDVSISNSTITVNTISPGTESIFIITYTLDTNGNRVITTNILQLTAVPLPFATIENFQYYAGDIPTTPVYNGPGTVSNVTMSFVSAPGVAPVAETALQAGQNTITYNFTPGAGSATEPLLSGTTFSSTFNIKVIPKPADVDLNKIIKVGDIDIENTLSNLPGSVTDYTITGITIDGTSISILTSGATHNGLTISVSSTQQITFQADSSGATTPNAPNPLPNGHQVAFALNYYPTGATYQATFALTISVFVWDPQDVRQVLASGTPAAAGTPRTQANSSSYSISGITGTLLSIIQGGNTLTGTSDDLIDWSNYSTPSACIYFFSTTSVVRNYFIFTTSEVVLFTVAIFLTNTPVQTLNFPTTLDSNGNPISPPANVTFDLLQQFYPNLETSLLNANATLGLVSVGGATAVPLGGSTLTAFNASFVPNGAQSSAQIVIATTDGTNTVSTLITTLNYICAQVKEPTLIVQNPEFIVPINTSFTVTSEMVSLDSQLTTSAAGVRNLADGILVSYATPGTYTVACTLTNQGTSTLPVTITFLAYDPSTAEVNPPSGAPQTSWTGQFSTTYSANILSYSINGSTYSPGSISLPAPPGTTSQVTVSTSGPVLTVQLTTAQPTLIITLKLADGNVGIFSGTYLIVSDNTVQTFVVEQTAGSSPQSATVNYYDISDVPQTTSATFTYVPPSGSGSSPYTIFSADGSGTQVGTLTVGSNSGQVTFSPLQPGIWNLTGLQIRIGTSNFPINPYVETIATIDLQPANVLGVLGTSLNYDLNDFVVSGIGQVVFGPWTVTNQGNTSSQLPPWMSITNGLLRTQTLTQSMVGTYTLSSSLTSTKVPGYSQSLSFQLIVTDPEDTKEDDIVLVANLASSIQFPAAIVSINGTSIASSATSYLTDNINFKLATPASDGTQLVTFSCAVTLQQSVVLNIITADSILNIVTVTQVPNEKNLNIIAFGYNGNIFKTTGSGQPNPSYAGSTVVSYIASGASVPPGQLSTTFNPNTQYTIGTASVTINTNGDYQISNAQSLTLTVTYSIANAADDVGANQTITINVGLATIPLVTIDQSPAPTILLGTNVIRVVIQGTSVGGGTTLNDGDSLNLGYATFTVNGNNLLISGVTAAFQPTVVQAENYLASKVNIVSMLIDINRDITTQPIYTVPANSSVQFTLPFEPSRLSYNTMVVNGSNQSIGLYTDAGQQFASVVLSGSALIVTSTGVLAFSRPIGFMDQNGTYTYIIVQTIAMSSVTPVVLSVGQTVQPPSGTTFATIGTLDGTQVALPGQTLNNSVQITAPTTSGGPNYLQVLSGSLTQSFSFYATLTTGAIQFYNLKFVQQRIYVSSLTQIPTRAFLGATTGAMTFTDSSISVVGNFVMNPNSLRTLTMTAPFYGQFTIALLTAA